MLKHSLPEPTIPPVVRWPRLRRWTAVAVWVYAAGMLAALIVLRVAGDRWWPATLMLFGPRWVYGAPLPLLVPLALWLRPRLLWPLAAGLALLLGPIMGLCVPWQQLIESDAEGGAVLRVLTCNAKGHCRDNGRLNVLIHETSPDVVAIQGC